MKQGPQKYCLWRLL